MHTEQLPPCEEKVLFMLLDTAIQYLDEASPEDRPEIFRKVHKALLNACIDRLDLKTPKQALKTILFLSERDIDYCNEFTCKLLEREEVWQVTKY